MFELMDALDRVHLYPGQMLFCKNGDTVTVKEIVYNSAYIEYKDLMYIRKILKHPLTMANAIMTFSDLMKADMIKKGLTKTVLTLRAMIEMVLTVLVIQRTSIIEMDITGTGMIETAMIKKDMIKTAMTRMALAS